MNTYTNMHLLESRDVKTCMLMSLAAGRDTFLPLLPLGPTVAHLPLRKVTM